MTIIGIQTASEARLSYDEFTATLFNDISCQGHIHRRTLWSINMACPYKYQLDQLCLYGLNNYLMHII